MGVGKYKTKKGERYQAVLYLRGQRATSRSGFKTKKAAKKWLHEEEARMIRGETNPTRMDFESLANKYLTEIEDRRKRNTYLYKRGTFRRFMAFYPSRLLLNEITRDDISEYHRAQKNERGPKAANRDLKELVTIFNWGIKRELAIKNPARQIEPFSEEAYVRYTPPAEDIDSIRMAATKEERQVIDTIYYTAGRLSEILELTWDDVNFESKVIRLWTSKRMNGDKEPRYLGMHQELSKTLQGVWNSRDKQSPYVFTNPNSGKMYTKNSAFIRELFHRVCDRAQLKKPFTAHCIRHHVASRFADSRKATSRQIQQFLGHMNLRTTEIYLHELRVDHDILDAFETPDHGTSSAQNDR